VGFWWKNLDAANFTQTVFTPLGLGHNWLGIAPVLLLWVAAAAVGAAATGRLPRQSFDAGRGILAVAAWVAVALVVPWVVGAEQSVVDGDTGALRLILGYAAAGLLAVGITKLVRDRSSRPPEPVDDHRPTRVAVEA
jgi:hypothetical protein